MASGVRPPNGPSVPSELADTDAAAFPLTPRQGDAPTDESPPSSYAIAPGSLLAGKYRVVRTIGHGGMGFVLAARHEQLDVPVAMKLLSPELVSRPEAVGRFLREARAASKLTSSHVTRVLDVGTLASGEPFMVMEYLAGEDLAYHAKTTRPSVGDVMDYVTQASDAIAEAHAAGIVHRDLKPANLFLTRRHGGGALVKVLDFGVSKFVDVPGGGDVGLTTTSAVLGSALYMSPEQMRSSKHVDLRTDIYALGACIYELLGGAPPFVADSFAELCAKAYTERPAPLSKARDDVPPALDVVIEKALAKEPEDRYPTVAALVQALSPFATESTRGRMRALFSEYAPDLEILPVAGASRPVARATVPSVAAAVPEVASSARGTWILVALGIVATAVGGAALWGWPGAPSSAASAEGAAPRVTTPTATTVATAARPAETAAPPTVTAAPAPPAESASTTASAPSAAPARPSDPAARRIRTDRDQDSPSRPGAGPSRINADLSEETCTAHMPDGTTRAVPCP